MRSFDKLRMTGKRQTSRARSASVPLAPSARARGFSWVLRRGPCTWRAAVGAPTVGIFAFSDRFSGTLGRRWEYERASYARRCPCHPGDTKESCPDYACIAKLDVPRITAAYRGSWPREEPGDSDACHHSALHLQPRRAARACARWCFEQTVGAADAYEVVLREITDRPTRRRRSSSALRGRATCAFEVIDQVNSGLAKGRNAGIARATGERIIFIDDDVLPFPNFVEEHLRTQAKNIRRRWSAAARSTSRALTTCRLRCGTSVTTAGTYILDHQRVRTLCNDPRDRRLERIIFGVWLGRYRRRSALAIWRRAHSI